MQVHPRSVLRMRCSYKFAQSHDPTPRQPKVRSVEKKINVQIHFRKLNRSKLMFENRVYPEFDGLVHRDSLCEKYASRQKLLET